MRPGKMSAEHQCSVFPEQAMRARLRKMLTCWT